MNETIFNGVSEIYAKYRPSYPQRFYEYLSTDIGLSSNSVVADIGSGTGILTHKLLEICNKVYAVEPNNDMRSIAENQLKSFDGFKSINGTAERTTLANQCVDYITVAQAFHWFERQKFRKECQRILKSDGKVILAWNCRDEKSELVREIDLISKTYCPHFTGSKGGMRGATTDSDFKDFFSNFYEVKCFQNDITFDEQHFIGLHQSASYRINKQDRNYTLYYAELKRIFRLYSVDGKLIMPNQTRSYVGVVKN